MLDHDIKELLMTSDPTSTSSTTTYKATASSDCQNVKQNSSVRESDTDDSAVSDDTDSE